MREAERVRRRITEHASEAQLTAPGRSDLNKICTRGELERCHSDQV